MSGQTDAPRTQDDKTKKTEATRCADLNTDEQTKSDASKITNIHVARIEKTQSRDRRNMRALASDEEPGKQDRFSSQGQEELLQAYQRPPAQQVMEAYTGIGKPQYYSQKRNYTSYGGQRRVPCTGSVARQSVNSKQSTSAVYHTGGFAAGTSTKASAVDGFRERSVNDKEAAAPSQAVDTAYSTQGHQGVNHFLVKTCLLQSRTEMKGKRDKVNTAYTVSRPTQK